MQEKSWPQEWLVDSETRAWQSVFLMLAPQDFWHNPGTRGGVNLIFRYLKAAVSKMKKAQTGATAGEYDLEFAAKVQCPGRPSRRGNPWK